MSDIIRGRRRRTSSDSDESLQKTARTFEFNETPPVRRRRTAESEVSSSQSEDDPLLADDSFILDEHKITNPSLVNAIDSIKAEIREESRYHSVSQFWDDSHDWGESESSDYWHYLGYYE